MAVTEQELPSRVRLNIGEGVPTGGNFGLRKRCRVQLATAIHILPGFVGNRRAAVMVASPALVISEPTHRWVRDGAFTLLPQPDVKIIRIIMARPAVQPADARAAMFKSRFPGARSEAERFLSGKGEGVDAGKLPPLAVGRKIPPKARRTTCLFLFPALRLGKHATVFVPPLP